MIKNSKIQYFTGATFPHVGARTYYIIEDFIYAPRSSPFTSTPDFTNLCNHVTAVFNGTPISSATCNHWLLLNLSSIISSNLSRSETFLFFTSTLSINEMIWVACRYNGSTRDRQASKSASVMPTSHDGIIPSFCSLARYQQQG